MGCITAKVSAINEPINVNVSWDIEHLKPSFALASEQLKVSVGLICTPDIDVYLKVTPTSVDIPIDGSAVYIQVYSNTKYKVY